jgi:histidinol dehydrogenase
MIRVDGSDRSVWIESIRRPTLESSETLREQVRTILSAVELEGDVALRRFAAKFDGVVPQDFRVSVKERDEVANKVPGELGRAIDLAIGTITRFHRSQIYAEPSVETLSGVVCWRKSIPITRVGLYIPGGTAPLFSTLMMLAAPARLAGCKEIVITTPIGTAGLPPAIAYIARALEIEEIYTVGGAQAIGALAFGSDTIPAVQKLYGPGNRFVTEAKLQLAARGYAIDLPAGPSEVLIIADEGADPAFVAADLLAQAEHGPDSQVVLVTTSSAVADSVEREVEVQLRGLNRKETAEQALEKSLLITVGSLTEAIAFSNAYAPEHLILAVEAPEILAHLVVNAGSVFLGYWSAEVLGDFASGTNHVLPTAGKAQAVSGVSVDSFVKKVTFQSVDQRGLVGLGESVVTMAQAEGLDAHARAVSIRIERAR